MGSSMTGLGRKTSSGQDKWDGDGGMARGKLTKGSIKERAVLGGRGRRAGEASGRADGGRAEGRKALVCGRRPVQTGCHLRELGSYLSKWKVLLSTHAIVNH